MKIISDKVISIIDNIPYFHDRVKIKEYLEEIDYYLGHRRIFENEEKIDDKISVYFKYLFKFLDNKEAIYTWHGWLTNYTLGIRDVLYKEYTTRVKFHKSDTVTGNLDILEQIVDLLETIRSFRYMTRDDETTRSLVINGFDEIIDLLPVVEFDIHVDIRDKISVTLLLNDMKNYIESRMIYNHIDYDPSTIVNINILQDILKLKYILSRNTMIEYE